MSQSKFTGGFFAMLGMHLLAFFLIVITIGIFTPWAVTMLFRWKCKHTHIEGQQLRFVGSGLGLLWRYILWGFLGMIVFGGLAIALMFMVFGSLQDLSNVDVTAAFEAEATMAAVWGLVFIVVTLLYTIMIRWFFVRWLVRNTTFTR